MFLRGGILLKLTYTPPQGRESPDHHITFTLSGGSEPTLRQLPKLVRKDLLSAGFPMFTPVHDWGEYKKDGASRTLYVRCSDEKQVEALLHALETRFETRATRLSG